MIDGETWHTIMAVVESKCAEVDEKTEMRINRSQD